LSFGGFSFLLEQCAQLVFASLIPLKGEGASAGQKKEDDLEQVTGTNEEEISDFVAGVTDQELLYGSQSLLAIFGPIIGQIVADPISYNVRVQLLSFLGTAVDVAKTLLKLSSLFIGHPFANVCRFGDE
jgi:hypothetical protein